MASNLEVASKAPSSAPIMERVNAIRDRWHTKRHPFFREFSEGRLPLKALGRYQALHLPFRVVRLAELRTVLRPCL